MSNGGYNFSKLSQIFKKKFDIECWVISFEKISFLKKIYYKFFKSLNLLYFEKKNQLFHNKKNFIYPLKFIYNQNLDLSKILNLFNSKLVFYFNDLYQRILAVKKKIRDENFNLTISNITRGLDGSILDKDIEAPSLCISHGIISKGINKHDEIYKKIIAESVFSGDSKYFSIQSKVMNESLKSHEISGKKIITGNIVFANANKSDNKKYLLFASTIKDFHNLQFLGVEMYYEYWNTLKDLDEISGKFKEKIVVKLHPTIKSKPRDLKRIFKNLIFSNSKIEDLLENAIALLSYSSSTIEDSLNSSVPVILYDPYERYEHLRAVDSKSEKDPIFYIKDKEKLYEIIKKIKNTKKFSFDNYIYKKNFDESVEKNILTLLS